MAYKYGMTKKEFMRLIMNEKKDYIQLFLDRLRTERIKFCVIGGLAVNAYVEPVVSLDLDIVVAAEKIPALRNALPPRAKVKKFPNSLNISFPDSDLRIQVQTDPRYQAFLAGSRKKEILGYEMPVARAEDVLQGKIWAALDKTRRASKRQKDLADILRLVEKKKALLRLIPAELKALLAS